MRKGLAALAAIGAFAAPAYAAPGAPAGNLRDAVGLAVAGNPEVEARWHAFKASREEQDVARGGFRPQVDLSAGLASEFRKRPGVANDDFTRRGAALSLRQMLYDGFETSSEVARIGFESLARYYELLDAAENTALEATRAYVDVLRYRELVALAKENYVQHRQVFEQIEKRTQAGVGRRVDLEQAAGRLALAESNLLTEGTNLHDVSARYQRVVGELPPAALPTADMNPGLPASIRDALEAAYRASPALAASQEGVRAAQAQARGKRAAMQPRLDLRARDEISWDADGIDGRQRDRVVELVFNYNLFNGGADAARIRQFAQQLNVAQDVRDKSCRDLRQTLQIAYNDVQRLGEQLRFLDQHQLSIAKAREAYRRQFDIGQRTLLDLLDTENEYFQARRAYASALHDLTTARVRTLAAMGGLLKALDLVRADLPTPQEIGQERDPVEASAACPNEAPAMPPLDLQTLLHEAPLAEDSPPAPVVAARESAESELTSRLSEWARAWSSRDVPAYLRFYAESFVPPGGVDRSAWEESRRRLVGKPGAVAVSIESLAVTVDVGGEAVTSFRQRYDSSNHRDVVAKAITWVREAGIWRIVREAVL